ncbi:MAG: sigma 54-interacting transcriptional regulator [Myxococcota bacterium]|nr:sigma 54-interacting transcriptional regulator [Myxococcota bacterium]
MSEQREVFTQAKQALLDGKPPIVYTHCRLAVIAGPNAGSTVETEKDLIRVGANPDNDLVVNDAAVSRAHFELHKKEGEYNLIDPGSSNGTFVGSLQVRDAMLRSTTEIEIGDSTLRFEPMSTEIEVEPSTSKRCGEMVGDTLAMREIYTIIERVAGTELAVLVTGETGTGKELVARAIHQQSRVKDGPFITLSLETLPAALLESALFGHEPGAFDGATEAFAGAFENADNGTLFLDGVDHLPLDLQARLLRALERGEIQRLRGDRVIRVNTRVIAAVGTNIQSKVEDQSFRNDLYYRLAVIRLDLPPLRYRIEDVPVIVEDFFERYGPELAEFGSTATSVSSAAMSQLCNYTFPGNVRELINTLRQAVAVATSNNVQVADLPAEITGSKAVGSSNESANSVVLPDASMRFKDAKAKVLDAFERQYLQDLLQRHQLNISKAAREAGIDRRHLYRLLEKYNIEIKERTVE